MRLFVDVDPADLPEPPQLLARLALIFDPDTNPQPQPALVTGIGTLPDGRLRLECAVAAMVSTWDTPTDQALPGHTVTA